MAKARIAVIGAGLMGHGIAQVFALAGHDVTIYDSVKASLDSAKARILTNLKDLGDDQTAVKRVTPIADLGDTVRNADYVVEAVLEDLPLKQKIFAEIEKHVRPDTILASNTSVIPITKIMEGLQRRERARRHPLVEPAVSGAAGRGDRDAVDLASDDRLHHEAACRRRQDAGACEEGRARLHRQPPATCAVARGDCAGRERHLRRRNRRCRHQGGVRPQARRLGPLENADMVGTDLTLAIHKTVLPDIDSRPAPSPYLEKLVKEGKLGFKSGEGFRKWSPEQQAALRSKVLQHLKNARAQDS